LETAYFVLMLIELFSLDVTAEALLANIGSKFRSNDGRLTQNFR